MNNAKITKVEFEYTGGGIWLFYGNLSDGTFFLADGDMLDVRIINADPSRNEEECWFAEWQEEHLVRDLDTEKEGPKFFKKIFKWLRANDAENISEIEFIEEEAKRYDGKTGWR